jgi:hypothetical protein
MSAASLALSLLSESFNYQTVFNRALLTFRQQSGEFVAKRRKLRDLAVNVGKMRTSQLVYCDARSGAVVC